MAMWHPERCMLSKDLKQAHKLYLRSLHKTYPLMKRATPPTASSSSYGNWCEGISIGVGPTITNKTLSLVVGNSTDAELGDTITKLKEGNEDLAAYVRFLRSGKTLRDGVENMSVDSVAVVAPDRKNGIPWFGRVLEMDDNRAKLRWLHKHTSHATYFYLSDSIDWVHFDAVICNGVDFEPIIGAEFLWKLVTPLQFIRALNQELPPAITQPDITLIPRANIPKHDISKLMFSDVDDFKRFLGSN